MGPFARRGSQKARCLWRSTETMCWMLESHAHVTHALKQIQGTFEVTVAYVIDVEDDVPYFVPERL
eukprot:m.297732 g.297732  ORF g.297732 m.297732 type:complete len:66 (-) comp16287_c2_seq2:665-862(-)